MKVNENIVKGLEKRLLEEHSRITIGDAAETTILETFKDTDMPLENIIVGLYNMCKINQYKIKNLENNLDLMAWRIYKTDEDFTEEEKEELEEAIQTLDLEQLQDVENNIGYLEDVLFCTEEDTDKMMKMQRALMNKVNYPTPLMYKTFMDMVQKERDRKCF